MDEFPSQHHMTEDMDAFADDTGYEGTFTNREFLFPHIHNDHSEKYDYFDPYDEEEWVVKGSQVNRMHLEPSMGQDSDSFGYLLIFDLL